MDEALISLLDYQGVLTAVTTTRDGLVIAAAGLSVDDAEILGAAGATLVSVSDLIDSRHGAAEVGAGAIHILRGDELTLVVLTDNDVSHDPLVGVMEGSLQSVEAAFF